MSVRSFFFFSPYFFCALFALCSLPSPCTIFSAVSCWAKNSRDTRQIPGWREAGRPHVVPMSTHHFSSSPPSPFSGRWRRNFHIAKWGGGEWLGGGKKSSTSTQTRGKKNFFLSPLTSTSSFSSSFEDVCSKRLSTRVEIIRALPSGRGALRLLPGGEATANTPPSTGHRPKKGVGRRKALFFKERES